MPKTTWAATVLVAALLLALLSFRVFNRPRSLPSPSLRPIVVQIQGEVRHPDVYTLPGPAATLDDALRAAGGLVERGSASLPDELLTGSIVSGTIVRAEQGGLHGIQITVEPMPASMRLLLGMKLDLNEASVDELLCIPRMKTETAQAIVERGRERRWRALEELSELPGVGTKTVEKWRSSLFVE
ncbi:MAG: helix-hairpin-helix domain-containing protein [Syntrophobacteraceae bacterium]